MCPLDSRNCPRIQRQLYHLTLPELLPACSELLSFSWSSSPKATCLCTGTHAKPTQPTQTSTHVPTAAAAHRAFHIPEILALILDHAHNDVRCLLTFLYLDRTTRDWASATLQKPSSFQPLRELLVESISSHNLCCFRRILSILFSLDAYPPHWSYSSGQDEPEDFVNAPAASLFERVFPRLPTAHRIRKAVLGRADLSRAAYDMLRDIPRLYPAGAYDIDKDVFYSLACRHHDTLEQARLLLIRDRASPERAFEKTGRSPLADSLDAAAWTSQSWSSGGEQFLPLDLTWLFVRGYRLRRVDVDALRRTGRSEIWEGMLRLAITCDRVSDEELLLQDASSSEAARGAQIRNEERKACEAQRREGSMWSAATWEKHYRARRAHAARKSTSTVDEVKSKVKGKADAPPTKRRVSLAFVSEELLSRYPSSDDDNSKPKAKQKEATKKRRPSLGSATQDILNRATCVSKNWKTMIPIGMPERALIESGGFQY